MSMLLTYSCSTGLYLLWCPWSCGGVTNDREGVGGHGHQSCYCHGGCGCVHWSIGGVGHLIHDDHPIGGRGRLPCECDGCEGTVEGL